MRILLLTQYFQPEPMFKGLPLAQALRERGHQVQVLTGFPNYPGGKLYDGYRMTFWRRESLNGVDVIRVPLFPSHDRSGLRRILSYLSFALSTSFFSLFLVKRPDVIYVYNLVTLRTTWSFLRLRHRSKVVLDVQDLWPEAVASSGMLNSAVAMRLLSWWCRNCYRSVNQLIVLSPGFKRNLVGRGVDSPNTQIIYNWCDESAINIPAPSAVAARSLGFAGKFNIIFAGTMGTAQSLETIIDAAQIIATEFPDVLFTFVGGGIEVDKLKDKAGSLSNIQFLPIQPMAEIGVILSNADVLLVHLKNEPIYTITIPSKIQAYMYAGKPILCGVAGDAADLVRESQAGICFVPQDIESLIQAVRELRSMKPSEILQMGQAGRHFYDERLSFEIGANRVATLLETVANRSASHRHSDSAE